MCISISSFQGGQKLQPFMFYWSLELRADLLHILLSWTVYVRAPVTVPVVFRVLNDQV